MIKFCHMEICNDSLSLGLENLNFTMVPCSRIFFYNAVICVFVTSRVLEDAIWSRGDTRRPARAHKVEAKFLTSLTDLELVQDIFKAYNVNFV